MNSPFLYYVLLAASLLWVRLDRRASVRSLFAYWWAGILLTRVVPVAIAQLADTGSATGTVMIVAANAIGSLLLLRAILGLTSSSRTWRRRTYVIFACLLLALLLAPTGEESGAAIIMVLGSAYLVAVPWREGRSARFLTLAAFTGLLSFLLMVITIDIEATVISVSSSPWLQALFTAAGSLAIVYGLVTAFRSGSRIHLSIRRVSRRLIASHLMSGFVPVVLVSLFLLIAGALYLSMYRGQVGSRYLALASAEASRRMSVSLAVSGEVLSDAFSVASDAQTVLILQEGARPTVLGNRLPFPPEALLARAETSAEIPLIWDGHQLYVRARLDTLREGQSIRYEVLAPLDSLDLARVSRVVGMPIQVAPRMVVRSSRGGVRISSEDEDRETRSRSRLDSLAAAGGSIEAAPPFPVEPARETAGTLGSESPTLSPPEDERENLTDRIGPGATGGWRIPGGAMVPCLRWEDGAFEAGAVPVLSSATFAEPVAALFSLARENPLATVGLILLAILTVLLLGVIWATTSMVTTMIRSVTAAVRALREATTAIGEGRLDHRIPLAAQDDLWSVAASFNEMAAGLERVRAMELQNQRLEQELQLAREIQHRLLPASAPSFPEFDIAGVSISAREVGGDYFDYIPLEDGSVAIAVADVSGKGAAAALLMSSFRASLRSHDVASLGPAQTLVRLNRFVHGSVATGKFITAFLGVLDPKTGMLEYSCAGHEPPLVIESNGTTSELSAGGVVLGLFAHAEYEEARTELPKGALLAIFTDGVTEAQSPEGLFYGETHLVDTLQSLRGESCPRVLERIVNALKDFSGNAVQFDDVTMVLARRL